MDGVILTPLKKIYHPKGDVLHAMKASDTGFSGFGEAYFSVIKKNEKKGWKKHTQMTLNIILVIGIIEFVIYDEKNKHYFSTTLSNKNHQRLTIEPGLWVAFRGVSGDNMLLNLASLEHDMNESENLDLDSFDYRWDPTV